MDRIILKVGTEYIKTEEDLENMHCATDENGNELSGLRLCRWLFNYVMDSKKQISELQDKLHGKDISLNKQVVMINDLRDKLHRRNLIIDNLRREISKKQDLIFKLGLVLRDNFSKSKQFEIAQKYNL
jgi:hypothetical protein